MAWIRAIDERNDKVWNKIGIRSHRRIWPRSARYLITPIDKVVPKCSRCMPEENSRIATESHDRRIIVDVDLPRIEQFLRNCGSMRQLAEMHTLWPQG